MPYSIFTKGKRIAGARTLKDAASSARYHAGQSGSARVKSLTGRKKTVMTCKKKGKRVVCKKSAPRRRAKRKSSKRK